MLHIQRAIQCKTNVYLTSVCHCYFVLHITDIDKKKIPDTCEVENHRPNKITFGKY